MKKNGQHRRQRRQRARTERRRRARAAAKRAAGPSPIELITPTDGSEPHLFDDCPICRAMQETGVAPDATGVVAMTPEQHAQYRRRLEEIVAEDGWPEDAIWVSGEEIRRGFDEINAALEANGYSTDTAAMDEDELDAHMRRVMEVIASRESAFRDRAAETGGN